MKKFTVTMSRTYETVFQIEAKNEMEAIDKLCENKDRYSVELEQCNVINEQIKCTKEIEPPKLNKYTIISTWNGDGHSYLNTAKILEFKDDKAAQNHLWTLFKTENNPKDFEVEETKGFLKYSNEEDSGSYIWLSQTELVYGIVIYTNVNEIHYILNAKQWRNNVAKAIKQADPNEVGEIDLTQKRFFIAAHNSDYDYQFIKF
jgi:hypothetical protein